MRRRSHFRRFRIRLRAWRSCVFGNAPFEYMARSNAFDTCPLGIPDSYLSALFPHLSAAAAENIVRQKLLTLVLTDPILSSLMLHQAGDRAPVVMALPAPWRKLLGSMGPQTRPFASAAAWSCFVATRWLRSSGKALQFIANVWRPAPPPPARPFETLILINELQLPRRPGQDGCDFVTTYRQSCLADGNAPLWAVVPRAVETVQGSEQLLITSFTFPNLATYGDRLNFTARALWELIVDGSRICLGQWWRAFAIDERTAAHYVACLPAERLARKYVFTSYNIQVRPLWTYVAARRGAGILHVFVSTNFEFFSVSKDHARPVHTGLRTIAWPAHAVWDEYQSRFLDSLGLGDVPRTSIDTIGFNESPADLPETPSDAIAVFDVVPKKLSFLASVAYPCPYYSREMVPFLRDIADCAAELGLPIAFKQKRDLGSSTSGAYRLLLRRLARDPGVTLIDPEISAHRVIKATTCVISAPFSSTALIGRAFGKPSIYYDTSGALVDESALAHGVPVIHGRKALMDWLRINAGASCDPAPRRISGI